MVLIYLSFFFLRIPFLTLLEEQFIFYWLVLYGSHTWSHSSLPYSAFILSVRTRVHHLRQSFVPTIYFLKWTQTGNDKYILSIQYAGRGRGQSQVEVEELSEIKKAAENCYLALHLLHPF